MCVHYSWVHPSTAVFHEGSIPEWCALVPHSGTFDTDANELDDTVSSVQGFVLNSYIYVWRITIGDIHMYATE